MGNCFHKSSLFIDKRIEKKEEVNYNTRKLYHRHPSSYQIQETNRSPVYSPIQHKYTQFIIK